MKPCTSAKTAAVTQELILQLDGLERTRSVGMTLGMTLGGALKEGLSEGPGLAGGQALCLFYGEMGAGKTTLIKAICEGLGLNPAHVISPTYTLVNIYPGRVSVYHVDLFRIERPEAMLELDRDDWINPSGLTLIEWPELALPLLEGEEVLELHLIAPPGSPRLRELRMLCAGASFDHVFAALRPPGPR